MARDTFVQPSLATPFDNATNGFVSTNAQQAIEEAKQNAEGFPRAGIALTHNGTVSDLTFITYSELLANQRILFPVKTSLKEFTWVNSSTNIRAFDIKFYKNGKLAGDLVYTSTTPAGERTNGYGYGVFPTLEFLAGDSVFVQIDYTAAGTSLSDLAVVLWIARIP